MAISQTFHSLTLSFAAPLLYPAILFLLWPWYSWPSQPTIRLSNMNLNTTLAHVQLVFHPPYDKTAATLGVVACVLFGYGTMWYGMRHQMYKQGYWK